MERESIVQLTIKGLLLLLLLALNGAAAKVYGQTRVALVEGSRVQVDGTSTVNRFACATAVLRGEGELRDDGADAQLVVPIATLDCGHSRMNRDLQKTMRANEYPDIRFELVDADAAVTDGRITVRGLLTIAGVTREIAVRPREIIEEGGGYRVRGEIMVRMSEFGLDPPRVLAGLVRVRDEIVVRYDVLAKVEGYGAEFSAEGNPIGQARATSAIQ